MKVWRIFPPAVCMVLSVILISCGSPATKDGKKDKTPAADKDEAPGTDAGTDKDAAPKDTDNKDAAPKDGDKKDAAPKDGDKKDGAKDKGAAKNGKSKYTIAQVMAEHKPKGTLQIVLSGGGNFNDKKKLMELYDALSQNDPPKGSKESWKKLTGALISAASEAFNKGDKAALEKLKAAANCKACHSVHKK